MNTELIQHGIKQINGISHYTGAHPKIRSHCRGIRRPTEFGDKIWATTRVLMDHIQEGGLNLRGLRVLEIGCGWGILGVFLAKTQGCQVTSTDLDPNVLPIVDLQANLNGVSLTTKAVGFSELNQNFLKNFDIVIGVEVCYSETVAKDLLSMMRRAFDSGVQQIIIADPGRPDFEDGLLQCQEFCDVRLTKLPGTVNGKTTTLLSAKPGH